MHRRVPLWFAVVFCSLPSLWLLGCFSGNQVPDPSAEYGPPFFVDKTPGSGIDFIYRNGQEADHYSILESLGGGVALLDYDNDGLLDIFVTGGGYFAGQDRQQIQPYPCKLYKNLGNWKFKDVTQEVGLNEVPMYSHGCAVADYDNDGWPDLLVTGWGRVALYHNEPLDPAHPTRGRRFREVSRKAGLTDRHWSTSAAWADFNGDGYPDLYICHYVDWSFANHPRCPGSTGETRQDVCPPRQFTALPHILYLNNGDGTFRDASKEAGLRVPRADGDYARLTHLNARARQHLREADRARDYGKGLGIVVVDVNDDGRPDIYVANDTSGNFLYVNKGRGQFAEVGLASNAVRDSMGSPNGSMGVDASDYDGSGRFSIFVTNYEYEAHALYRNRGGGQFAYASRSAGIFELGFHYVGFGTGFLDFDRDGNEDLFISNGHVLRHLSAPRELRQEPVLLRNKRQPGMRPEEVRFENVSPRAGPFLRTGHIGRGAAFGDLDNDGKIDIVISHLNEPVVLLQNCLENGNHWLGIELVGKPYRDAVGAKLTLEAGGQQLVRTIRGGGSYLSASDRRIVFGLGQNQQAGRLTVRWLSGRVQTWSGLAIDRYWRLDEGQPNARERSPRL
jgi:hypothetical protein